MILNKRLSTSLDNAKYSYHVKTVNQITNTAGAHKTHSYEVGDKQWLNRILFSYVKTKSQGSDKLRSRRFEPFVITNLVGENAAKVELPDNMRIHHLVHMLHTTPYALQPEDISQSMVRNPDPIPLAQ